MKKILRHFNYSEDDYDTSIVVSEGTECELIESDLDEKCDSGVSVLIKIIDENSKLFNYTFRVDAGLITSAT